MSLTPEQIHLHAAILRAELGGFDNLANAFRQILERSVNPPKQIPAYESGVFKARDAHPTDARRITQ